MRILSLILLAIFCLPSQIILAQSFEDAKCAIPHTMESLEGMYRENRNELYEYKRKLQKIDAKSQLSEKDKSKKRNLLALQTLLKEENKIMKDLLVTCRKEKKDLTKEFFDSSGSTCLAQYDEQIPKFDAARNRVYNLINADLDEFETPASNQTWFSRALELSKSIVKGAVFCLYVQSAVGMVPAADKSGLIKTKSGALPQSSNSSAVSAINPTKTSLNPISNLSLVDFSQVAPLDTSNKHRPITGFDLLLGGESRGTTYIEPWINQAAQGTIKDSLSLIDEFNSGKLPKSVEPVLQTMKSSVGSLLKEWLARDPTAANNASNWAAELSNRLSEYSAKKTLPPKDIYLEFSHFASQARGESMSESYVSEFYNFGLGDDPTTALEFFRQTISPVDQETMTSYFLPGFSPLSIMDINRLQGLRLFPIGMTLDKKVEYDDIVTNGAEFTLHDFDHAFQQIRSYENAYTYLRTKLPDDSTINTAFSDTQQAFRDLMSKIHKENKHLAMGIEAVFFHLTHEETAPLEPMSFISVLNDYILPLANDSKVFRRQYLAYQGLLEDYAGVVLSADDFKEILKTLNNFFGTQIERFGLNPKDIIYGPAFYERLFKFLGSKNINWSSRTADQGEKELISLITPPRLIPYSEGKIRSLDIVIDLIARQKPSNPEESEPFQKMKQEIIDFLKNEIALRESGKSPF